MGNAVGPVACIAAGVWLGYLALTGRASALVAFITSGGSRTTSVQSAGGDSAQSGQTALAPPVYTAPPAAYGSQLSGNASQMKNAAQQSGDSGAAAATGDYVPTGGP